MVSHNGPRKDGDMGGNQEAAWEMAWDDVTGKMLRPELVRQARVEELEDLRKLGGGPIEEDIRTIGKHPIGARWVDINKQDEDYPEYRSSLAAKEIKRHPMLELYAATPPLECFRMLSSDVAIETQQSKSKKLMVRDVSRAYFYAPSIRPVYVKIIGEDLQNGRTPRSIGHEHHKEH